jgi:GDP-L-fucose synthase
MSEFDLEGTRVWVAGHRGMVGGAIVRRLEAEPIGDLLTATSEELDLRRQADVEAFVSRTRPQVVFLAAARVGGIGAHTGAHGAFLYDNLMIEANVIEATRRGGVEKLVHFGSSCIYPREAPQPIREEALLTGPLEPTNEGYAVAKIAAVELGTMYRREHGFPVVSLMLPNLYGPGDNFNLRSSHVLPALLRKIHEAKAGRREIVEVWGTGRPVREYLHVDDLADAAVHCLRHYEADGHLNVGTGEGVAIRELAELIGDVLGWNGRLVFDPSIPDGFPRKVMDVSRLHAMGWRHRIVLRDGIESTHRWFSEHLARAGPGATGLRM